MLLMRMESNSMESSCHQMIQTSRVHTQGSEAVADGSGGEVVVVVDIVVVEVLAQSHTSQSHLSDVCNLSIYPSLS